MSSVDKRIRQVAIVLQSLDASTAKGLLAQLPPEMGRAVKQTMVKLGSVSTRERSEAFDSLEGLLSTLLNKQEAASPAAALVAEDSTIDRVEISSEGAIASSSTPELAVQQAEIPWLSWAPSSLATFLANERPSVIATVLNQVSPERAKELLDHLPIKIAGATLAAIPHLKLSDPSILNDILLEIDRKLPRTPPEQAAITIAGMSKLESIINQFGPAQRQAWLETIAQENPEIAMRLGWQSASRVMIDKDPKAGLDSVSPVSTPTPNLSNHSSTTEQKVEAIPDDIFEDSLVIPIDRFRNVPIQEQTYQATKESTGEMLAQLVHLSNGDLVTLLHSCERDTVMIALRGSNETIQKRVEQIVAPKDLRRYRRLLHTGPHPNAEEIRKATNQVLAKLQQLIVAGRIAKLENASFLVAA